METWNSRPKNVYSLTVTVLVVLAFLAGAVFMGIINAFGMNFAGFDAKKGLSGLDPGKNGAGFAPIIDDKGTGKDNACKPGGDEVFGSITGIKGKIFTLKVVKGEGGTATIETTDSTTFVSKIAGREIKLADLKEGDLVHIVGKSTGKSTITAETVVVLPAEGGEKKEEKAKDGNEADKNNTIGIEGQIVQIDDGVITVRDEDRTFTFKTSKETFVINGQNGEKISTADLKVGDDVLVKGVVNQDGSMTALAMSKGKSVKC